MSNLRILGGEARGRPLEVPHSARPTGVRVRKSLFDWLEHRFPEGSSLVDLFAGSGAVGLEAASRGFRVTLVERDLGAVKALQFNLRSLKLEGKIVSSDALNFLSKTGQKFDIAFVDPPFTQDIPPIAKALLEQDFIQPGGVLIVQHPNVFKLPEHAGYTLERRDYGSNALSFYTKALEE